MKRTILISIAVLLFAACNQSATATPKPTKNAGVETYGAPVPNGQSISITEVLKDPDKYKGKPILVDGIVRKACEKKGCWMEVAESGSKDVQGCRVTFKDYGFFVRLDAAGSKARMQGELTVEKVSKDHVAHLEQEGAHFAKKLPDGSAHELRMVATGVELAIN